MCLVAFLDIEYEVKRLHNPIMRISFILMYYRQRSEMHHPQPPRPTETAEPAQCTHCAAQLSDSPHRSTHRPHSHQTLSASDSILTRTPIEDPLQLQLSLSPRHARSCVSPCPFSSPNTSSSDCDCDCG
jgi:hypothetical protein